MKDEEQLGYCLWKSIKSTEDNDEETAACNDILFSLIEENVKSFFAIQINEDFKNIFDDIVKRIKIYMNSKFGQTWIKDLTYQRNYYKKELLESPFHYDKFVETSETHTLKFLMIKPFIDGLNDRLAITVQETLDGKAKNMQFSHLTIIFPTRTSKSIFESRLGGRKIFPEGHCFAHASYPNYDPENPLKLKFPLLIQGENEMVLGAFPDANMSKRLFNILPELVPLLGIETAGEFVRHQNNVSYIVPFTKIIKNNPLNFKITTPEFLLGFTRLLLLAQFPRQTQPGVLYAKIDEEMQHIFIKSTEKLIRLDVQGCERLKASMQVDNINIDFKTLPKSPIDIPQNKNTFITLISAYGILHSEFTLSNHHEQKRPQPIKAAQMVYYLMSQAEINIKIQIGLILEEEKQAQNEYKRALCHYKKLHSSYLPALELCKSQLADAKLHTKKIEFSLKTLYQQQQEKRKQTGVALLNLMDMWKKYSIIKSKSAENENRLLSI